MLATINDLFSGWKNSYITYTGYVYDMRVIMTEYFFISLIMNSVIVVYSNCNAL